MTDLTPFRKAFILCSAVALTAGLSACESKDLNATFAQIKAIRVDANAVPISDSDAKKLKASDVELVVKTAQDLTVNKGGLMDKTGKSPKRLQVAVVDPLEMPRIDHGQALDERVAGQHSLTDAPMDILRAVMPQATNPTPDAVKAPVRDTHFRDTPVRDTPVRDVPPPVIAKVAVKDTATTGRLVQIGSFSSMGAAQQAWSGLKTKYPTISRYSPSYQKITTTSGQAMVRLKVGPVSDEAQARSLCDRLDIRDNWCVKAG